MKDLSVIISCDDDSYGIGEYADNFLNVLKEVDIELIIVNASRNTEISEEVMQIERKASDRVLVINCDGMLSEQEAFETGLEYARGCCFIGFSCGESLSAEKFDTLLYDSSLVSESRFRAMHYWFVRLLALESEGDFGYLIVPQDKENKEADILTIVEFTFFHNGERTTYDMSSASEGAKEEVLEKLNGKLARTGDSGILVFRKG